MRWWFVREQRALCARACAASYVTERTLQRLYPTGGLEVAISDVLLPNVMEWAIPSAMNLRLREHSRRREVHEADTITVASIGSMDQLYKGFDVLIKAIALCQRDGLPLRLTLVGDGRYRSRLEELASRCGVAALVTFTGHVGSSEDVRRVLGSADLFVLASRTEGLPRVLLEAMALGLPCLGSEVGGIPELLPTECLVPRDDHITLAATLHALATNPAEQERLGKANIVTAARFCEDAIGPRRLEFYKAVRQATEKWNAQHAHP
jgi:glycosyltransferase involved in cell wall biosynthesis